MDVCANSDNAKCERFFAKAQDGLKQVWSGRVWCNPPYGREIGHWVQKAQASVNSGSAECVVMLIPSRTETRYWHKYIWDQSTHAPHTGVSVRLVKGRLKFGNSKSNAPFPSAVVIFQPLAQTKQVSDNPFYATRVACAESDAKNNKIEQQQLGVTVCAGFLFLTTPAKAG